MRYQNYSDRVEGEIRLAKLTTKDKPAPHRDWVARAAKTGDWSQDEARVRKALARSGAEIRQSRSRKLDREKIRAFEGPAWEREPEPSLADDDDGDQDLPLADEPSHVDDELDVLPTDAEEARLAIREPRQREATLRAAYAEHREKGGHLELPDRLLDYCGGVAVSEIDLSWVIDVVRAFCGERPAEYQEVVLLNLADILGLEINREDNRFRGVFKYDLAQQQEWQRQHEEEPEQDDDDADEADEETWGYDWENELNEQVRRIEQQAWSQRRNWAGVTRPLDGPPDPPPDKPFTIRYPSWSWQNYNNRMTGIRYTPNLPKENRFMYWPAEWRGVQLKGRKPGRPANPNKLTNAEKQKRYREKLKTR
jgi:hypothetical protein